MGGEGSGRWGASKPDARPLAEDCRRLDVNDLVAAGIIGPDHKGGHAWRWDEGSACAGTIGLVVETGPTSGVLRLVYKTHPRNAQPVDHDHAFPLETTVLRGGGRRWWFRCEGCGRRAAVLFMPHGREFFACRTCHGLAYKSTRLPRLERELRAEIASLCRMGPQAILEALRARKR